MIKFYLKNLFQFFLPKDLYKTFLFFSKWIQIKSKIPSISRKEISDLLNHPGMISPNEKTKYVEYAFKAKGNIVEFGVYLGASTSALALGRSKSKINQINKIYAFDSFSCPKDHNFADHIKRDSFLIGYSDLIELKSNSIDWYRLTGQLLKPYSESLILKKVIISPNNNLPYIPNNIEILNLDLPKDIETFKLIAEICFQKLNNKSLIIFQDFIYHFSGDLIAFFNFLIESSVVELLEIVSTSGIFKVIKQDLLLEKFLEFYEFDNELKFSYLLKCCNKFSKTKGYNSKTEANFRFAIIERLNYMRLNSFENKKEISYKFIHEAISLSHNNHYASKVLSEILTSPLITL